MRARRILLLLLGLVILGAVLLVALPAGRAAMAGGVAWLRGGGPVGQLVAVGLVVAGIPLGLPTLWFAALIGYLYGAPGILIALPAVLGGAVAAFALARWLMAGEVERLLARRRRWRAINLAVGEGGVKLVVLLRLAGPHNMLNLALAASPLSLGAFALGTAIGALPSVTLATVGGALAPDASSLWQAGAALGPAWIAILLAGGAALVAAVVITVRATRAAMLRAEVQGSAQAAARAAAQGASEP